MPSNPTQTRGQAAGARNCMLGAAKPSLFPVLAKANLQPRQSQTFSSILMFKCFAIPLIASPAILRPPTKKQPSMQQPTITRPKKIPLEEQARISPALGETKLDHHCLKGIEMGPASSDQSLTGV